MSDNAVAPKSGPGQIMTEYNVERIKESPGLLADRLSYMPAGRYGEPDEVARTIVLLAAAMPDFMQGHNLVIDGGYTAH